MGGIAKQNGMIPQCIGGVSDHVHILVTLLRPIIPYPRGRFFRGALSQALRARLRSVLSLRDALAEISQQHLASGNADTGRQRRGASPLDAKLF